MNWLIVAVLHWNTGLKLSSLCSTGVGMDPVCSHAVLREGDHRGDPAWRGPQRSRVVWSCGAAGLPAGSCDHVSARQCVQLFFFRGPVQHKMSLNEVTQRTLETDTDRAGQVSHSCYIDIQWRKPISCLFFIFYLVLCILQHLNLGLLFGSFNLLQEMPTEKT